jgi:hypothetical protein
MAGEKPKCYMRSSMFKRSSICKELQSTTGSQQILSRSVQYRRNISETCSMISSSISSNASSPPIMKLDVILCPLSI